MTNVLILCVMIIYLGGMIFIGVRYAKDNNSVDEFYLGGRKLGPLVTAMSAEASDMSAYLLMGIPGVAFLTGLSEASWTVIGLAVGTWLNWLIVARRLRLYTHQLEAITLPQFFANRWGDKRHVLSAVAALIIIVFFIPYTASGFSACGKLFGTLFGADYHVAMLVSALIIILYTVLGGFLAVSTTDFIQSIIMTIALAVVVLFSTRAAGGIDVVLDHARSMAGYLSLSSIYDPAADAAKPYGFFTICSTLAWGLGYFGMPHILLRFMAVENPDKLALSRRVATVWVVLSMGVAVCIGVLGRGMVMEGAMGALDDPETVVVGIARLMSSHGVLATLVAAVILSGILAATMSTADSQLLAASSSVSQDLFVDFFGVKLNARTSMLVARGVMIGVSLVAIVLAWNPDSSVFRVVSFAWAGFGACFGPTVLFALFWKRSNRYGALAGMLVGGVMIFVWKFVIAPMGGVLAVYELLPAFLLACLAHVIVSLVTPPCPVPVLKAFDRYQREV